MSTLTTALKIFKKNEAALRANEEWYVQMVRDCAKEGYRPEYCRHGAYLWVEWDVICGHCENGEPTAAERRAEAIYAAKRYEADIEKLGNAYRALFDLKIADMPELCDAIMKLRERYGIAD